jgi:hypothetical protein
VDLSNNIPYFYGKIVLEKSLTVYLHSVAFLSVSFALTRSGVGVVPTGGFWQKGVKVQEIKRMFFERAAHIVKFLGGDYENLNGDFGNGAGPWLYGLAGIQQRR